jgi:glycosyltransferase involved in cell wall biosynthesis
VASGNARERAALVVTVLNEADAIDILLQSVLEQTRVPDEVVVVDGGSVDSTLDKLKAWQERLPLRVLEEPGSTIARGRNVAIGATTAELVAVSDAGVRLRPDWLANLLACMSGDVDVVSGFFVPEADSTFERAMAATVLPTLDDIQPQQFLPSSRSVLVRRSAWQRVGGYPEWLDYCEDLVFDLTMKQAGCRFAFAPKAVVLFRPRGSLRAFFRQYFLYARGDGRAGLWLARHAVRYATYVFTVALLCGRPRGWWLLLALGALAYTRRPYQRLAPMMAGTPPEARARAIMLVPIIRLVGDIAKMLGFPVGVWWRWNSRSSS